MDNIRPFSENISYGQETDSPITDNMGTVRPIIDPLFYLTLDDAKAILEAAKNNKKSYINPVTGKLNEVSPRLIHHAKLTLHEFNWWQKKWKNLAEAKFDKFLLKKVEPSVSHSTKEKIAENLAKGIAKTKNIKLSGKLLAKWTGKILPWVGWGVVVADLVRRGMKELGTNDKSETNNIPHGEFYHKDIGWY